MNLADVASDLYALLPEQFTAARNEKAKSLTQAGDRELAGEVRRLPRPSAAAWLVNALAAVRHSGLEDILAVGASMRQAQGNLDRERLKELGEQRQRLLASLMKDSRSLAEERGMKLSGAAAGEVEQTLRAAMADAHAASAVSTGRLVRSLTASGWEPVDLAGAVAGPFDAGALDAGAVAGPFDAGALDTDGPDGPDAEPDTAGGLSSKAAARLRAARDDLDEAKTLEVQARAHAQEAVVRLGRADATKERLAAAMEDLQQRIADLKQEIKTSGREAADAERDRAEAQRIAGEAADAVDTARRRVEELSGN